jgi:hypothetical protein
LEFLLWRIDSNDYFTVNKVPFRLQWLHFHDELLSLNLRYWLAPTNCERKGTFSRKIFMY